MPRPEVAGLIAGQDGLLTLDRAVSSLSTFLSSNSLSPAALVQGTKVMSSGARDAVKIVVSSLVRTYPVFGIVTTEVARLPDPESGPNILELPNTIPPSEDNPFDNIEEPEDVQQVIMGEQPGPVEALSYHSFHALMRIVVRFVGPLSLIVVPGLLLGVVTGQLPWGIALCGAIATVLSFFVGLHK